jgi:hypothetical protein
MKRRAVVAVMLMFILIIGLINIPNASAEDFTVANNVPMLFGSIDNSLWVVKGDFFYLYDLSDPKENEITEFPGVTSIGEGANSITVLSERDGAQYITVLNDEGAVYAEYALDTGFGAKKICYYGSMIYILTDKEESIWYMPKGCDIAPEPLYAISSETGFENSGIIDIAMGDGMLYTLGGDGSVCAVDIVNSSVSAACTIAGAVSLAPASNDAGSTLVYVWREDDTSPAAINIADGTEDEDAMQFQDCAAVDVSENMIFSLSASRKILTGISLIENLSYENTLYIINCISPDSNRFINAETKFHEKYPDIELVHLWIDDPRALATRIMSGKPGLDILFIQENIISSTSANYAMTGATLDLSQFESIAALPFDEYIDFTGAVSAGGRLYGMPDYINMTVWLANEALAQKTGAAIPDGPWTWDEFFEIADMLAAYNAQNGTDYALLHDSTALLPYLMVQYNSNNVDIIAGTADYDNAGLVKRLEQWKAACDAGLIRDKDDGWLTIDDIPEDVLFSAYKLDSAQMGYALRETTAEERLYILPPVENETTRYPINVLSVQLCANCVIPEAAAHFIACYMAPDVLTSQGYSYQCQLLKDASAYPNNDEECMILDRNVDLWTYALENSVQEYYIGDLYNDQRKTLYPAFIAGEISAEEYAKTCQRRADMVLGE